MVISEPFTYLACWQTRCKIRLGPRGFVILLEDGEDKAFQCDDPFFLVSLYLHQGNQISPEIDLISEAELAKSQLDNLISASTHTGSFDDLL